MITISSKLLARKERKKSKEGKREILISINPTISLI